MGAAQLPRQRSPRKTTLPRQVNPNAGRSIQSAGAWCLIAVSLICFATPQVAFAQQAREVHVPVCDFNVPPRCTIVVVETATATAFAAIGRPDAGALHADCWQRQETWDQLLGQVLTIAFADRNPTIVGFDDADALFGRRSELLGALETHAALWQSGGCYTAFGGIAPGVINPTDVAVYLRAVEDEVIRDVAELNAARPAGNVANDQEGGGDFRDGAIGDGGGADDDDPVIFNPIIITVPSPGPVID